jgi:HAD superfamily hydrolase (TIGR01549 family)
MTNIKMVVFDFYGTLAYLAKETKPYARLFTNLGLQTLEELRQARTIALTEDFDDLSDLAKRIKPDLLINTYSYQQEVDNEIVSAVLYEETIKILSQLKDRQLRLGLISNLASPYKRPFFELGLDVYFDEVIFSCEVGLKKPDQKIYQLMVERVGINPTQMLMIGDSAQADVVGPKYAGLNAVLLDRTNSAFTGISNLEGIFQFL